MSLRAIAGDLNARGIPTVTGSHWTPGGVSRILDGLSLDGSAVGG